MSNFLLLDVYKIALRDNDSVTLTTPTHELFVWYHDGTVTINNQSQDADDSAGHTVWAQTNGTWRVTDWDVNTHRELQLFPKESP